MRYWLTTGLMLCLLSGCVSDTPPPKHKNLTRAARINTVLGLRYLDNGNHSRGKQKIMLAMQQAPNLPEVQDGMAYYMELAGEINSAEKHYRKAIYLGSNEGSPYNNYGTFLCRQGKYRNAIKQFEKALQQPKYANTAEAYENAGMCALHIPDYPLALHYSQKALKHDPSRATARLTLAKVFYKTGQLNQSKQALSEYHKRHQPSAESLWIKTQIARKLGANREVAKHIATLKRLYPQSKEYKQLRRLA